MREQQKRLDALVLWGRRVMENLVNVSRRSVFVQTFGTGSSLHVCLHGKQCVYPSLCLGMPCGRFCEHRREVDSLADVFSQYRSLLWALEREELERAEMQELVEEKARTKARDFTAFVVRFYGLVGDCVPYLFFLSGMLCVHDVCS